MAHWKVKSEVTFNVLPVNDAPWAGSEEINSTEDEFFVVEFKYGDSDSEEIEFNSPNFQKTDSLGARRNAALLSK